MSLCPDCKTRQVLVTNSDNVRRCYVCACRVAGWRVRDKDLDAKRAAVGRVADDKASS